MQIDRRTLVAGTILGALTGVPACAAETAPTHLNLILLGHQGHGKTMLARAIRRTLGQASPPGETYAERAADTGGLFSASELSEFRTSARSYSIIDGSGAAAAVPTLTRNLWSADAAVMVVSAADGPMLQTREHIFLARQMRVEDMVVFLNKTDLVDDAELIELVELETRELLSAYQLKGDEITVVTGSAKIGASGGASDKGALAIRALLRAIDALPAARRDTTAPFRMPIEDVFHIRGRGVVVTGRVGRGRIAVGDALELAGPKGVRPVACRGLEMFRALLERAEAGDFIGIELDGVQPGEVERGDVLVRPGTATVSRRYRAETYILTSEEMGLSSPAPARWPVRLYFADGLEVGAVVQPEADAPPIRPGENRSVVLELETPMALERATRFAIRAEDRTLGAGVVVSAA